MIDKFLLQRVQIVTVGHALDGINGFAVGLDAHHQTGAHQDAIHSNTAGTAIAGAAAFLGAGHVELVAQHVQQGLSRIAQQFMAVAVDRGVYILLGHQDFALSSAMAAAL